MIKLQHPKKEKYDLGKGCIYFVTAGKDDIEHLGDSYIVDVEIDFQNVPLIFLYISDDGTLKHAGDSGENLYLVFNKKVITKDELIEYCNKYLLRVVDI